MSWVIFVNWSFGLSDSDNYLNSLFQVENSDTTQYQAYDKDDLFYFLSKISESVIYPCIAVFYSLIVQKQWLSNLIRSFFLLLFSSLFDGLTKIGSIKENSR